MCLIIFKFNLCLKEINFKSALLKRNKQISSQNNLRNLSVWGSQQLKRYFHLIDLIWDYPFSGVWFDLKQEFSNAPNLKATLRNVRYSNDWVSYKPPVYKMSLAHWLHKWSLCVYSSGKGIRAVLSLGLGEITLAASTQSHLSFWRIFLLGTGSLGGKLDWFFSN